MSEQLWGRSEQLERCSEQVMSLSKPLEHKSEQLRNVSEQNKGMAYQRICLVLLNTHIVADDRYACRARRGARSIAPNHWSTPGGGEESVEVSREAGRGAKM